MLYHKRCVPHNQHVNLREVSRPEVVYGVGLSHYEPFYHRKYRGSSPISLSTRGEQVVGVAVAVGGA